MSHIATTDTFFIDAPVFKSKCWICGITCNEELGWVGVRCSNCGSVYDLSAGTGHIIRKRRELLKLTRRQMSELAGLKPSTIKKYEWCGSSKRYWFLSARLTKKAFKSIINAKNENVAL